MGATLLIRDLAKSYGRGVQALDGVSLDVAAGEWLALEGPPGSGKSTLLNLIAGFATPDSGLIEVDGAPPPVHRGAPRYRRETVGIVFQLHHLLPELTACTNVELALMGAGLPPRERHACARLLLERVGLLHRAEHSPAELSGGERQCVAVARALANQPRLLLADEPTASLDRPTAELVLDAIEAERRRHGMTVIVVSHDPQATERADRCLVLRAGRLEEPQAVAP